MTDEEPGYAEAMSELDQILERLDRDDIDIDQLSAHVSRAASLIELCRGRIEAARVEVERVVVDLEGDDAEG